MIESDENGDLKILVPQPSYHTNDCIFNGLKFCLDSLHGNKIEVTSFVKNGNVYSGVIHYTLYDHFGLDSGDLDSFGAAAGVRAWYILQHWEIFNGDYRPFTIFIDFDIPFSFTLN